MPVPDPKTGNLCVWLISCFFFITLVTGGTFLVIYISSPGRESTAWFPVAGMVLVGLPWIFWCLTCLYRCVTRAGFRDGDRPYGGGAGGNVNAGPMPRSVSGAMNSIGEATELQAESPSGDGRRVRFGAVVVVDEPDGGGCSGRGEDEDDKDDEQSVSNGGFGEISSFTSHESEMPLASSRPT